MHLDLVSLFELQRLDKRGRKRIVRLFPHFTTPIAYSRASAQNVYLILAPSIWQSPQSHPHRHGLMGQTILLDDFKPL